MIPTLLLAFAAGVLTIAAPCTLPVLPVLVGTSLGQTSRLRPLFIALGFVASFAAATLLFSAITDVVGLDQNSVRTFAAALLLGFGAALLWPAPFERVAARAVAPLAGRIAGRFGGGGAGKGFMLGTTLGLVWTPCAGPVLGSILTVIATSPDAAHARTLLVVYAVGAALPLLALAYGGQAVSRRLRRAGRVARPLQQAFGIAVIVFAVATYFQYDVELTLWLGRFYPNGQIGL
ncbi:MAG TPA: cytochrome c biogenesis protein CcdA [Xanthobacteraceae bacterium]|nr:cytochrome c biogenesis protein CcdA [Xanthobacteraceae bacterium]